MANQSRYKIPPQSKGRPKAEPSAYKLIINEVKDVNGDGAVNLKDVVEKLKANKNNEWTALSGDGDFRSPESVELLKQADIVITNPPFSLFREYVAQLIEYDKKFLIIGNNNAITYKEIFKLIHQNKLWLGYGRVKEFMKPDKTTQKFGNISWFTNLDTTKRHEFLTLYKKYTPEEYPKYDNYDAINVNRVAEIPEDYDGVMGVPITFLDKFNPDQFEILDGIGRYSVLNNKETRKAKKYLSMINNKAIYFRYIIKRKEQK